MNELILIVIVATAIGLLVREHRRIYPPLPKTGDIHFWPDGKIEVRK